MVLEHLLKAECASLYNVLVAPKINQIKNKNGK